MTRQLRSQVCLGHDHAGDRRRPRRTASRSTRTSATATARARRTASRSGSSPMTRRRGASPESVYRPDRRRRRSPTPPRRRRACSPRNVVLGRPASPLFRYYAYAAATAPATPELDLRARQPGRRVTAARIAQIELAFVVAGERGRRIASRGSITLRDDVYVRAGRTPTTTAPNPHMRLTPYSPARLRAAARRPGRLLHARRAAGHVRGGRLHRRRLRGGPGRPPDQPQLAGPQGRLRGRRVGRELLPVPARRGQRLLARSATCRTPTRGAIPVNQPWNGSRDDRADWRTIPGSTAQYTIELVAGRPSTRSASTATPRR